MNKEKLKIEIDDYWYDCADGCCTYTGTTVKINGVELSTDSSNVQDIVEDILQHLGYKVEVIKTYNGK